MLWLYNVKQRIQRYIRKCFTQNCPDFALTETWNVKMVVVFMETLNGMGSVRNVIAKLIWGNDKRKVRSSATNKTRCGRSEIRIRKCLFSMQQSHRQHCHHEKNYKLSKLYCKAPHLNITNNIVNICKNMLSKMIGLPPAIGKMTVHHRERTLHRRNEICSKSSRNRPMPRKWKNYDRSKGVATSSTKVNWNTLKRWR